MWPVRCRGLLHRSSADGVRYGSGFGSRTGGLIGRRGGFSGDGFHRGGGFGSCTGGLNCRGYRLVCHGELAQADQ